MNVDYWDIIFKYEDIDVSILLQKQIIHNQTNHFLLNWKNNNFDYIEKYVYDISIFHLNKLNISLTDDIFIEFWIKNETKLTNLHIDCDEFNSDKIQNLPFLSCVVYLNDHHLPTLITGIDFEKYKYKQFYNETSVKIIFPKKNTNISFDGSYFHGMVDIYNEKTNQVNSRNILAINLWKKKPINISYYTSNMENLYNKKDNMIELSENNNKNDILTTNVLDYFFYEKILYDNILYLSEFSNLIKSNHSSNNAFFFNIINETTKNINQNISILDKTNHNISIPNSRFVLEKFYPPIICDWIIMESIHYGNIYGWTTTRHANYPTTDIPLKRIQSICSFFLFSFETILKKIGKLYGIPIPNVDIEKSDIFVVKYDMTGQQELEPHVDGSNITISIMLSDSNDYMGGGTQFESDQIVYYLEKGDILIHNGKDKHSGLKITKGTRYVLVMFINC